MKTRSGVLALVAVLAVLFSSSVSTAAGATRHKVNFKYLYDNASNTYSSFGNIAAAHNKFVKHHRSDCRSQSSQWWPQKATKDEAVIASVRARLGQATKQQQKKKVFGHLMEATHDLKKWSEGNILPRVVSCKQMPDASSKVAIDLSNVSNDLGLGIYG